MAERNPRGAQLIGHPIQDAATQSGTERAHGFARRNVALDDRVGVLVFDMKRHTARAQVSRQYISRKPGLLLIQVDRDQFEIDRCALAQADEQVQEGVAVFAPRDADHDPFSGANHVEVPDCLPDQSVKPLGELVALALSMLGSARRVHRGAHG